jgi:hypothetical protein
MNYLMPVTKPNTWATRPSELEMALRQLVKGNYNISKYMELLDKIERLSVGMPEVEIPVKNTFVGHLCAREIQISKGTFLTGTEYIKETFNIISKGRLIIWSPDGAKEIYAPMQLITRVGDRKSAYAVEDTVFTTIFPTDKTSIEEVIEEFTTVKLDDLYGNKNNWNRRLIDAKN